MQHLSPNCQNFVPTPQTESPNRQNSNDFRTKNLNKIKDIHSIPKPKHKDLVALCTVYEVTDSELTVDEVTCCSSIVREPHSIYSSDPYRVTIL